MRSRAEWLLRAIAIAALTLLVWDAMRPSGTPAAPLVVRDDVEAGLVTATRRDVDALDVELASAPGAVQRDWLKAVRGAGTRVTWRTKGVMPAAIAATRMPEPEGRVRISLAAADSARFALADGLGVVDTIHVSEGQTSRAFRTLTGPVTAEWRGSRAAAGVPPRVGVRRVLVIGSAGWESKFAIAALEEAGWTVDARIRVSPAVETRQGRQLTLDTAQYSAVVAIDGAGLPLAGSIVRFVNSGGGAVLAGTAARIPALAALTPATTSAARSPAPRRGSVLAGLKPDAEVLESVAGRPLVAARRARYGRVIASGYDETWRWRMSDDAGPAEHRQWWSALVTAVAYVPGPPVDARSSAADAAPVAALHAVLGPPASADERARARPGWTPPVWLVFAALLVAVIGEVLSRRLRGLA